MSAHDLILPTSLGKLEIKAGVHRKGMKVLVSGQPKTGKSYFAAHFPSPKIVLVCGDHGIEEYLDPAVDRVFDVTLPSQLFDFATLASDPATANKIASFVIDPLTLAWEDWMDFYNEKYGGDIRAGQWKDVKAPWKLIMRRLMRSPLHVCMTAWIADIVYDQSEVAPGIQGKLEIRQQEKPKVEKRVPHVVDMILNWRIEEDKLGRPTPFHVATYWGGRRPKTVPPGELHVGKEWRFDERKPEDPWKKIIVPILDKWQIGGADWVGIDPQEARADHEDLERTAQDFAMGQMIRLIAAQTKLADYRTVWSKEIEGRIDDLSAERRAEVMKAHEAKKKELGA